ncbi:MAG: hypothetical protein JO262_15200 [Solirubrobacterales bacterium]|nr:hypothetical protein [Solirubrobacterales bacterium]
MNIVKGIVVELRERRLWPVAVALVAALVAVPVLLSKSATSVPAPQAPFGGAAVPGAKGVPVTLAAAPDQSNLKGATRDPFTQQVPKSTTATSTGTSSTAATTASSARTGTGSSSGASGAGSTGSTAATSGSGSSPAGAGGTTAPAPTPVSVSKPAPVQTGLTSTEAYAVELSVTNPDGSVADNTYPRDSVIPNTTQPLLVLLGVGQGGHNVLFAVQPGTGVSGPGTCTPGTIDCEILSLSPGQTEQVSTSSGRVADFAVTSVDVNHYGSAADAQHARQQVSVFGAKLLRNSPLSALSLFQYDPNVGAIVDLRNLTVGGN